MSPRADVESSTFVPETVHLLLGAAHDGASGMLAVQLSENHLVFSVHQGRIRDLAFSGQSTLERAFSPVLDAGQLKKAARHAAKQNRSVGEAILDLQLVAEDDAVDRVVQFVSDCFARLLILDPDAIEFTPGDAAEGYISDLGANYEICLPVEELLLDALAQLQAWEFVVEHFSLLRDVYYATPSAVTYFHQQDRYPVESALLQTLDGQKDVEEALAVLDGDPFQALKIVQQLAEGGTIDLVNPVQLFQMGLSAEESGDWRKALKLYQRALERGLDDFDLQFRLANALQQTGDKNAAMARYLDFAEKCAHEFRFDDTLRAMHRIIELDQSNIPIRRRYIQLLTKYDKKEEATAASLDLAQLLQAKGRHDEAVRILGDLKAACPDDSAIRERYVALCEECGAHEQAHEAREELARIYADRQDTSKALEYYQRLFVEGEDTLDVRRNLVNLHLVQGNRDTALEHMDALLAFGNPYGIRDLNTLRELHQKRCDLKPGESESSWFLAEDALARKDIDAAERTLRELSTHLVSDADRSELISVLKRLMRIQPEKIEYRWHLAKEQEKCGDTAGAVATLRQVAALCRTTGQVADAERALYEILRIAPFDSEAREELRSFLDRSGDRERILLEQRHLALLRVVSGDLDKAQALCREIVNDRPQDAYLLLLLADACARTGDNRMAAEQYARAGKALLAERNLGLASHCMEKLRRFGTHAALVEELQKGIEETSVSKEQRRQEEEAFTPMKQRVIKRSVNTITARLRDIKSGRTEKTAATCGGGQTVTCGIASTVNKLKTLGAGGGAGSETPAKSVKLGGAMARLKALKGGGAAPAEDAPRPPDQDGGANSERTISTGVEDTKPSKLGGAMARLKALKSGGAAPAEDAPRPPDQDGGANAERTISTGVEDTKPARLGGAAARLAKLRNV